MSTYKIIMDSVCTLLLFLANEVFPSTGSQYNARVHCTTIDMLLY